MKTIAAQIANNWKSGLSVSLVSIPLSVSLAIAGGGTPIMGIITAIWAGLFAAIVGGSNFNIVGPTGALSGILAMYAFQYGVGALPILAVLTGIITLVVWALRWDKYIVLIPSAAVHGFTLGVAFIIGLNQFNFAFGLRGLKANEKFIQNVMDLFSHIGNTDFIALGIFIAGLALMFALLKKFPKVPNAIVVAILGIALGYMTTNGIINIPLDTLATKFGQLQATLFILPQFTKEMFNINMLQAAGMIAIIAILETLISAKIADGMTRTRFNQTKEVLGLGLANIFSGIFGGMPATAALARTSLNVKTKVILSLKNLFYLDVDGIDALAEIVDDIRHKNGEFAVVGIQTPIRSLLAKTKWFNEVEKAGLVVESREEAMHLLHR